MPGSCDFFCKKRVRSVQSDTLWIAAFPCHLQGQIIKGHEYKKMNFDIYLQSAYLPNMDKGYSLK